MIIKTHIFDEILLSVGVPQRKIADCFRWAAGDDVDCLELHEFFQRWNERHSDIFIIDEDSTRTFDEVISQVGIEYLVREL